MRSKTAVSKIAKMTEIMKKYVYLKAIFSERIDQMAENEQTENDTWQLETYLQSPFL